MKMIFKMSSVVMLMLIALSYPSGAAPLDPPVLSEPRIPKSLPIPAAAPSPTKARPIPAHAKPIRRHAFAPAHAKRRFAAKPAHPKRRTTAKPIETKRPSPSAAYQPKQSQAATPAQPKRQPASTASQPKQPAAQMPAQPKPKSAAAPSQPKRRPPPITIGEYGSMSGLTAPFGQATNNGISLAVEYVNRYGGVNGSSLVLKIHDDHGSPEMAAEVAKELISDDKVSAVIGEVSSRCSIAAAPVCNHAMVPMISPSATSPKLTKVGPYIFRVCFTDPYQGGAGAKFAYHNLHAEWAAIMVDSSSEYSIALADVFKQELKKLGGTVLTEQFYTGGGSADFRNQLRAIKSEDPDLVYIPGYFSSVGPIARQARSIGLKAVLLGGDGWDSPILVDSAGGPGRALEGSYFTNHYSLDTPLSVSKIFIANYRNKYGADPSALAAMGYDAVGVLVDAMQRIGRPADDDYTSDNYREKLRDAIAATKNYAGVTGSITMGPDGNPAKPVVVLRVHGEDFKYVTSVDP